MTTLLVAPPPASVTAPGAALKGRISRFSADHIIGLLIGISALVTRGINLGNYPRWFIDEGVYVSQAWAVKTMGELAPYTYWYDHPPLGWVQIASWFGLTGALERNNLSTILAGREFMMLLAAITSALIYAIARRIGMHYAFALMAAMLYVLSPLSVAYSRYVLLDNISVMWVLAAIYLALNPRRKLSSSIFAAICMGFAVLSKETSLLFIPAVVYIGARQHRHAPNRTHALIVAATCFVILGTMYPLSAALKGELFPGPGHVSLWDGQIMFQLSSRQGSGNIIDPHSNARQLAEGAWLGLDRWLPYNSLLCLIPALLVKKTRGIAIALGTLVAMMLRGGYLPYPYIIGMLPFMALVVAGVADWLWSKANIGSTEGLARLPRLALGMALPALFVLVALPTWLPAIGQQFTSNPAASQQQALAWVEQQLPRDITLITEGELWLDIVDRGYTNTQVVWIYKVDTDPAVRASFRQTGIDYLLLNQETIKLRTQYTTVDELLNRSSEIVSFGQGSDKIALLKVGH